MNTNTAIAFSFAENGQRAHARRARQRGIALAVSLILLLVITLIAVAAMRGTSVEQKITANFYDREIAFQNAEAALDVAAQAITAGTFTVSRNCGPGGTVCQVNPFTDSSFSGTIFTVTSGTGDSQFSIAGNATGQPQYVIENMGLLPNPTLSTGFSQTANAAQYGTQGAQGILSQYYRITARSGDPAQIGDRAIVTLQAFYRR